MKPPDFAAFIQERTKDFTGREWVLDEIDAWLADPQSPDYFFITGEPGIGKSAIAARLTQIRELDACHFCIAHDTSTVDPIQFAHSISKQLSSLPGFTNSIIRDLNLTIDIHQDIEQVYGEVIGAVINVSEHSARLIFNQLVMDPIRNHAGCRKTAQR